MEQEDRSVAESRFEGLSDSDLLGLRLAGQVLGHKASLAGRPRVARWFADLEALAAAQLARRGVGMVLTAPPTLGLPPDAEPGDRALLADYLGLLAANEGLSDAQRAACQQLLESTLD